VVLVVSVMAGALALASVSAEVHQSTSFAVGAAPGLKVDARLADVAIAVGQDGRIVVDDTRGASTITRAGAADAVGKIGVGSSQRGDQVVVSQSSAELQARAIAVNRHSTIRITVPVHTDLDVLDTGSLRVQGLDAVVRVQAAGSAELRDVTLRNSSALDLSAGELAMRNVHVSGGVTVTKRLGDVRFDGTLAPGGSSLDINAGGGAVTIALPQPTDARAGVATQVGSFDADPAWHFSSDQAARPRRWTADLGPDPKGTVTVQATLGDVRFDVR
jgi:hypothetical protein